MNYGGLFDPDNKLKRIEELNSIMNDPSFWTSDNKDSVINELNSLKGTLDSVDKLRSKISDNLELGSMLKEEPSEEIETMLINNIEEISKEIENVEMLLLLNGPYDKNDCILDIHPGAGGTESCDWANMLYRMYTRYA